MLPAFAFNEMTRQTRHSFLHHFVPVLLYISSHLRITYFILWWFYKYYWGVWGHKDEGAQVLSLKSSQSRRKKEHVSEHTELQRDKDLKQVLNQILWRLFRDCSEKIMLDMGRTGWVGREQSQGRRAWMVRCVQVHLDRSKDFSWSQIFFFHFPY